MNNYSLFFFKEILKIEQKASGAGSVFSGLLLQCFTDRLNAGRKLLQGVPKPWSADWYRSMGHLVAGCRGSQWKD